MVRYANTTKYANITRYANTTRYARIKRRWQSTTVEISVIDQMVPDMPGQHNFPIRCTQYIIIIINQLVPRLKKNRKLALDQFIK